jgi:hypothetical protein
VARTITNWKDQPDDHDYPAAETYLTLLMPRASARKIVTRMRKAPLEHWKAKDILRASRLPLLPPESFHVAKDLKKVNAGKKLSPALLVRGRLTANFPLTIADGYYRICASCHLDEETEIPCRMADQEKT